MVVISVYTRLIIITLSMQGFRKGREMKKVIIVLLLYLTIINVLFALDNNIPKKIIVIAPSVCVYINPTTSSKIICQVNKNDTFTVLQEQESWYEISLPEDKSGWVFSTFIKIYKETIQKEKTPKNSYLPVTLETPANRQLIYKKEYRAACLTTIGHLGVTIILAGSSFSFEMNTGDFAPYFMRAIWIFAGGVSILPVSTSYFVKKTGEKLNQNGTYLNTLRGAYAGALLGAIAGAGLGFTIRTIDKEMGFTIPIFATIGVCCGDVIGAVKGYNSNMPKSSSQGFLNRLHPPSLSIRPEKIYDNKTITAFNFKLINARF